MEMKKQKQYSDRQTEKKKIKGSQNSRGNKSSMSSKGSMSSKSSVSSKESVRSKDSVSSKGNVSNKNFKLKAEGKKNQDFKSQDIKKRNTQQKGNESSYKGKRTEHHRRSVDPNMCPVAKKCGGCQLQGVAYEEQLKRKQKKVTELLGSFGKIEPIIGMKDPSYYRNKVHAVFDRLRNGTIISGVYQEGTHIVVPVDSCQIENQKADAIIRDIRDLLKSFKIKTYDEDTGYGLLRHVLIRTGHKSGEIMVVLVLGSPILPSKNNFVKALRKLHPEITTIVLNINDKRTNMILGDRENVLFGKGYIEDELCECTFRISPKSFYQVNPVQTEILYEKAISMAGLTGKEKVIDAYCGIGTIGLVASKHASQVIGVELNKDAVKDAIVNAKRNEVKNIVFYAQDAGQFMTNMAMQGETADVVFMDPPRAGSDEAFLGSVAKLAPKKVVYISCNPETQARDLKYLVKKGYQVKKIQAVDMFPMTGHVECVVLMSRVEK